MKLVEINTSNNNNINFNTFTNIVFSIIISIGIKLKNIISLWLVIAIIQIIILRILKITKY